MGAVTHPVTGKALKRGHLGTMGIFAINVVYTRSTWYSSTEPVAAAGEF